MRRCLILVLLTVVAQTATAGDDPNDYAYAVPITGTGNDALYRVVVPPAVHEAVAFADLRDVRIFNGAGEVVPHAFRPQASLRQRSALVSLPYFPLRGSSASRAEDFDISVEKGGGRLNLQVRSRRAADDTKVLLGYVIDATATKEALTGLNLDWNTRSDNYTATVRLDASEDLKTWVSVVSDAPLVSLTHAGERLERRSVEFAPRKVNFLRLTWSDPSQSLELSSLIGVPAEQVAQAERAWKEVSATADPDHPGDYQFDLGGMFPMDRMSVRLPEENTLSPVQILSRASASDPWLPSVRATVYRLKQNGQELHSPDLTVRTNSHRYWLVRADAKGGGFGGGTLKINAGWTPREIVFAARGSGPFRMAYGNGRAAANALPIETVVPGWGGDRETPLATAGTGPQVALAGPSAARQAIDFHRVGLWVAMGAGVLLLAWMVWRLARQMNKEE